MNVVVGRGADRFLADPRGEFIARVDEVIERQVPAEGSLLVLPEGCMINFLTRRRSPTRYFNFMPPEMLMFGEQSVLAALQLSPPDAVVLVHKDTSEYGLPLFGRDYGAAIYAWVRAHYEPARLWTVEAGQRPLEPGTKHAVALLKRRR